MRIRSVVAVAAVIAGLCGPVAVYAAPVNSDAPVHATSGKDKVVKFSLRNGSGSPLELKVGDRVISLDTDKTVSLELPVGTRILVNAASPKHQAGELLAETSTAMDKTTLTIR
jgi:hypothetical protein